MCSICNRTPCNYRCPNYTESKVNCYCSVCGEEIQNGEEYIENYEVKKFILNVFKEFDGYLIG